MRIWIRNLVDTGSGMEKFVSEIRDGKIRIRDKHLGSATLEKYVEIHAINAG